MSSETGDSEYESREGLLGELDDRISDLSAAIRGADPDSIEEEQIQIRRYHELGYLVNQFRKLQRDTDLDEMKEELEILQKDDSTGSD